MRKIGLYVLMIILLILVGGFYLDKSKSSNQSLVDIITDNPSNNVELKSYGAAPEFSNITHWLNSEPLTMQLLKGKVVLIDFWTYSCINCIRTLPYVTGWYEKYKDKEFVVVGVHTPEFAFEKDTGNVQTALNRHNINYPVAQDNDYATWRAFNNHYWPAHYLIDQSGKIVYTHFGEGKYQETEQAIQQLLGIGDENEIQNTSIARQIKTPEIYFGLSRLELIVKDQKPTRSTQTYDFPSKLPLNSFALSGSWQFNDEVARLQGQNGKIRLNFYSKDVHMVAQSSSVATVRVYIDEVLIKTLQIKDSDLYTLYEGQESSEHTLELEIQGTGFEVFTFTFG